MPSFYSGIPRAFDGQEVAPLELPLVRRDHSPRYLAAERYDSLKVRTIHRTYPVYAPGPAPAVYLESLKQKEPSLDAPIIPPFGVRCVIHEDGCSLPLTECVRPRTKL